jgi:hypothetical protein
MTAGATSAGVAALLQRLWSWPGPCREGIRRGKARLGERKPAIGLAVVSSRSNRQSNEVAAAAGGQPSVSCSHRRQKSIAT